jgi:hypothetical protein
MAIKLEIVHSSEGIAAFRLFDGSHWHELPAAELEGSSMSSVRSAGENAAGVLTIHLPNSNFV